MKTAREVKFGDVCYFYNKNGKYTRQRTVKMCGINNEKTMFFSFGDRILTYPEKNSVYGEIRGNDNELIFFSKEAASEFFSNK